MILNKNSHVYYIKFEDTDNIFNSTQYKKLESKFRNCWISGRPGMFDGIIIFNKIIGLLHDNTYFTVKKIINQFYCLNSDLPGLGTSKLVSYLDENNRHLYKNNK